MVTILIGLSVLLGVTLIVFVVGLVVCFVWKKFNPHEFNSTYYSDDLFGVFYLGIWYGLVPAALIALSYLIGFVIKSGFNA